MRVVSRYLRTIFALTFLVGLQFILPSRIEAQTVERILAGCENALEEIRSPDTDVHNNSIYCFGVVAGITQVLWFNCSSRDFGNSPSPELVAAFPPSRTAAIQAFVNWARINPDNWGDTAELGMLTAITEAFPCRIVATQ